MSRRPVIAWLLALAVALTSVTAAVGRAQAAGATEIVICSGYGIVTLTLDEQGNPTGPVHDCPFCLAAMAAAVLPDLPVLHRPLTRGETLSPAAAPARAPAPAPLAQARGPPGPAGAA